MILGIGIDVVHINRMERWNKIPGLYERFFHKNELNAAKLRGPATVMSLAARFAAKEAFGKALGTGLAGLSLKNIQVINNHNGKPDINIRGKAKDAFINMGGKKIFISLTHERDNAIAVVIIEG